MRQIGWFLFAAVNIFAADVNTFSIVAYDPSNGDCGVTVASKYFSVGSVVPWAEAGTGCVATQAIGPIVCVPAVIIMSGLVLHASPARQ